MTANRVNWPLIGVLLLNFLIWAVVLIPVVKGLKIAENDAETFTGKVPEHRLGISGQTSHQWPEVGQDSLMKL